MANSINRYEPTSVTRLPDLVDRLFRESFVMPSVMDRSLTGARATLPVNLFETGDGFIMHVALPGLKSENLDIQVVRREVMIKGTIELPTPENGRPVWSGVPTGEFQETFTLPVDLNGDAAGATYESGILTLTLPKAEHLRPKSISVEIKK